MSANPYEAACDRLDRADENLRQAHIEAHRLTSAAQAEWEAAEANLGRYETKRGLALPQYREQVAS